ncbi:MAG TPA: hypothetical protein VHJ78_06375 [Actinomycetota bacterium]|nr:hypothetical protein [Actinomycetota bacterium]
MKLPKSPLVVAVVTALVTACVVGGVAIAQTNEVITACVGPSTNVRIVGDAADCKTNERLLTWNQQGAPGPQGPQGVPGVDGADGAPGAAGRDGVDGTDGVSGWVKVEVEDVPVVPQGFGSAFANCPEGKKVLGGGFHGHGITQAGSTQALQILHSRPFENGDGWMAVGYNPNDFEMKIGAYALCAATS